MKAINYFVAQKYVEAFALLASSPQQKTVIVPAEMSALLGTLAGVADLVGAAKTPNPPAPPAPSRSAVPKTE